MYPSLPLLPTLIWLSTFSFSFFFNVTYDYCIPDKTKVPIELGHNRSQINSEGQTGNTSILLHLQKWLNLLFFLLLSHVLRKKLEVFFFFFYMAL